MTSLHLVRVTPFLAASLLFAEAASAQTSTRDAQSLAVTAVDSNAAAPSDRFRVRVLTGQETPPQRIAPSPWISMVPSNPYALRGPSFQSLQTVPFSVPVATAADAELESRFVARRTIGGILLGLSSPFLVSGGVLFYTFGRNSGSLVGSLVNAGGMFLGALSCLVGVGFFIPGIIYTVTDPSPPSAAANRIRPTLHIGPGSASLSLSF